jgi:hypothetical protein
LRPVTGITKLNPSIFSKVFLNFCPVSILQHLESNYDFHQLVASQENGSPVVGLLP